MTCLVRYGAIPEIARCRAPLESELRRGESVIVRTHRGLQLGSVVDVLRPKPAPAEESSDVTSDSPFAVLRTATHEDLHAQQDLRRTAEEEFHRWVQRIEEWQIDVQLIDLEWTLDRSKLILYVLNERGPECTRLAIQAAAAGLGIIEVQPVSRDGLVSQPSGGGCGSCGCHN